MQLLEKQVLLELPREEIYDLCEVDSVFFSHVFFNEVITQKTPAFHREIWDLLDGSDFQVNIQCFRGSAKTTLSRIYVCKRIAYRLSKTILLIGKSEGHAALSLKWIKQQIEENTGFAQFYRLSRGSTWSETSIEILCKEPDGSTKSIWLLALGITGSTRGINVNGHRPDLIVADDVMDEENTATVDQRTKIAGYVYNALLPSLTPITENPNSKFVNLNTPFHKEDFSYQALDDTTWKSAVFGCWTEATKNLGTDQQISRWPERWSSETLRAAKKNASIKNRLSGWIREHEVRITSPETSSFKPFWLQRYTVLPELSSMTIVIAIDPVPPPSEVQIAKGLRGKDYESFAVVGRYKDRYYLIEYRTNRGHNPDWSIKTFFELALKYRPLQILVEAVAYQRTLAWIFRTAMEQRGQFFVIKEVDDKRAKYDRIVDGLAPVASNQRLYVNEFEHSEFITQFTEYPDVSNDDLIESVAVAVAELHTGSLSFADDTRMLNDLLEEEKAYKNITQLNDSGFYGAP